MELSVTAPSHEDFFHFSFETLTFVNIPKGNNIILRKITDNCTLSIKDEI